MQISIRKNKIKYALKILLFEYKSGVQLSNFMCISDFMRKYPKLTSFNIHHGHIWGVGSGYPQAGSAQYFFFC